MSAMAVGYDGKATHGCTSRCRVDMCLSRSAEAVAQAGTRRESQARGQFQDWSCRPSQRRSVAGVGGSCRSSPEPRTTQISL